MNAEDNHVNEKDDDKTEDELQPGEEVEDASQYVSGWPLAILTFGLAMAIFVVGPTHPSPWLLLLTM